MKLVHTSSERSYIRRIVAWNGAIYDVSYACGGKKRVCISLVGSSSLWNITMLHTDKCSYSVCVLKLESYCIPMIVWLRHSMIVLWYNRREWFIAALLLSSLKEVGKKEDVIEGEPFKMGIYFSRFYVVLFWLYIVSFRKKWPKIVERSPVLSATGSYVEYIQGAAVYALGSK